MNSALRIIFLFCYNHVQSLHKKQIMSSKNTFFSKKSSLSDWLILSNSKLASVYQTEDRNKNKRLKILSLLLGYPVVENMAFSHLDIINRSKAFMSFIEKYPLNNFAIRLNPLIDGTSVKRNRNIDLETLIEWIKSEDIDPYSYQIIIEPHVEGMWSLIFNVDGNFVSGEIINAGLVVLTQGNYGEGVADAVSFSLPRKPREDNEEFLFEMDVVNYCIGKLMLKKHQFEAAKLFSGKDISKNNLMNGYYEVIIDANYDMYIVDFNRVLPDILKEDKGEEIERHYSDLGKGKLILSGRSACKGSIRSTARIISLTNETFTFNDGDVLVSRNTTTDLLPLMKRASAVITDMGGALSHAAIVCRELDIPCIVATRNATSVLKDGVSVFVDATTGNVYE